MRLFTAVALSSAASIKLCHVCNCGTLLFGWGSMLDEHEGWMPSITIKQVLHGIFELLDNPNINSPAQSEAYRLFL